MINLNFFSSSEMPKGFYTVHESKNSPKEA